MERVHVIVNPISARGQTEKRWQLIKEAIKSHFREFKYIFTEKPKQATEIVRRLLSDGFDLIIGVGGDGTLNEIANGFFKSHAPEVINQDAALSIIPSGTGSDFVRAMKIPRDFRESVAQINRAKKRRIDIGRIMFGAGAGPRRCHYFINVADFGLGAEVIKRLADRNPLKRGPLTYYKGLLSSLLHFRSKKVSLEVDGQRYADGRYVIGAVANGPIFGGGMIIAPQARPDDGYFDLVLVEDMGLLEIVGNTPRLYSGTIARNPKVRIVKARNIKVDSQDEVSIEYDGELGECLPAEFQLVERAINFKS